MACRAARSQRDAPNGNVNGPNRGRSLNLLERLDFAEAYLVAQAEATGVGSVLSFDRSIDRISTVIRAEP
jgi:hypothetical protein